MTGIVAVLLGGVSLFVALLAVEQRLRAQAAVPTDPMKAIRKRPIRLLHVLTLRDIEEPKPR